MPEFDLAKLLENMDPAFRERETLAFERLMRETERSAAAGAPVQTDRYEKAIRLLAASVYVIARDLDLPPADVCVVATYTIGLFAGASCRDGDEVLGQIKRLFAVALEDASADKSRAAGYVAEIVGDGIDLIRKGGAP